MSVSRGERVLAVAAAKRGSRTSINGVGLNPSTEELRLFRRLLEQGENVYVLTASPTSVRGPSRQRRTAAYRRS